MKKDKYDVMKNGIVKKREIVKNLKLFYHLIIAKYKLDRGIKNDKKHFLIVSKILEEKLPNMEKSAHLNYELSKEIDDMEYKELILYLEEASIDPRRFDDGFIKKVCYSKGILLFCSKIQEAGYCSVKDPKFVQQISNIKNDKMDADANWSLMSETIGINMLLDLSEIHDERYFNINELRAIEKYHKQYMESFISPKVEETDVTKKKVIKCAKKQFL